jgi:multiple sugar transport system permease protein
LLCGYCAAIFNPSPELEDAARIDGCNRLGACCAFFASFSTWACSYFFVLFSRFLGEFLIALSSPPARAPKLSRCPLQNLPAACIDFGIWQPWRDPAIPPILLALLFQRYLISGLTSGAVK